MLYVYKSRQWFSEQLLVKLVVHYVCIHLPLGGAPYSGGCKASQTSTVLMEDGRRNTRITVVNRCPYSFMGPGLSSDRYFAHDAIHAVIKKTPTVELKIPINNLCEYYRVAPGSKFWDPTRPMDRPWWIKSRKAFKFLVTSKYNPLGNLNSGRKPVSKAH